jgi:LysM repeat protein
MPVPACPDEATMWRRAALFGALVGCLLLSACGSGGSSGNNSGPLRALHNPASAATATPPERLATPLAAVSVSQSGGSTLGAQPNTVVVKAGDTLGGIAAANGVSLQDLERANGLNDNSVLHIGDTLTIPRPGASPTPSAGAGGPALATPGPLGTASAATTIPPTGGAPSGGGAVGTPGAAGSVVPAGSAAAGATQQYTVASGDTACKIAVAHNVSVAELAAANGMTTTQIARLQIGQLLKIPPPTGHRDC